jgi:hypothetical protein
MVSSHSLGPSWSVGHQNPPRRSHGHESELPEFATHRRDGFAPAADSVPSAVGVPQSIRLSPDEYAAEVHQALQLAQEDEPLIKG